MDTTICPRDTTVRFAFTLTAPTTPGTYTESWRLLEEGIAWFGPTDIQFNITVTPARVPGDFDGDQDVDQDDFGDFQLCLTELGRYTAPPSCLPGDLNDDSYVDSRDATLFPLCMTAPGVPGNPSCP